MLHDVFHLGAFIEDRSTSFHPLKDLRVTWVIREDERDDVAGVLWRWVSQRMFVSSLRLRYSIIDNVCRIGKVDDDDDDDDDDDASFSSSSI